MSRFRRYRGRYGYLGRRRWRWRNRRRRRYRPTRRLRYRYKRYRRRNSARAIRRLFFKPNPGTEPVRITKPYNSLGVTFQGIILIPQTVAAWSLNVPQDQTDNYISSRVAKIDVSFANLLRAVLPLDYISKIGGPIPGRLQSQVTGQPSDTPPPKTGWPYAKPMTQDGQTPTSNPSEWWRWALLLMHPTDNVRFLTTPQIMNTEEMGAMFAQYQLLRHEFTRFKVECIDDGGLKWSPVASLAIQNQYWEIKSNPTSPYTAHTIVQPGTQTEIVNQATGPRTPTDQDCPTRQYPRYLHNGQTPDKLANTFSTILCKETGYIFPSFATLSAMGAPWAFPPQQKPVGRGSFNKHKMKGRNDPLKGPWMTLLPKNICNVSENEMVGGDLNTIIGTLFLAQGSNHYTTYKFMTMQDTVQPLIMQTRAWAAVKIQSRWTLANTRRPYRWDVAWSNTTGKFPQ
ncbi:VP1 [Ashy storm petrel gyrovirus]|uniref:Capsid protein n=1 Tax=Ashy storm petrel gyrovirus TaxID=2249930 RepID=A0A2Z4N430_9VIRU|nr:VP1 [Ashy storm petrel gyrovirus]AWX63610.1 VP1 [Ashy storm petrel gyrovirus]